MYLYFIVLVWIQNCYITPAFCWIAPTRIRECWIYWLLLSASKMHERNHTTKKLLLKAKTPCQKVKWSLSKNKSEAKTVRTTYYPKLNSFKTANVLPPNYHVTSYLYISKEIHSKPIKVKSNKKQLNHVKPCSHVKSVIGILIIGTKNVLSVF